MTDGLHGTDAYTTCPECGCVSGRVGEEYVARHMIDCALLPTRQDIPEMPMRERIERTLRGPGAACYMTPGDASCMTNDLCDVMMKPSYGMYEALCNTGKVWRELDSQAVWQTYIQAIKDGK